MTIRLEYDEGANAAYLQLGGGERGSVSHTLQFVEEDQRDAWGINLDFDQDGRLVGIEFEDARAHVPPELLGKRSD